MGIGVRGWGPNNNSEAVDLGVLRLPRKQCGYMVHFMGAGLSRRAVTLQRAEQDA